MTQLYFSGSFDSFDGVTEYLIDKDQFRLCTFAYPKEAYYYLDLADSQGKSVNMMIDSGAFTVANSGKTVHLHDLIAYHKDLLARYGDRHNFVFISLDVIVGAKGRKATEAERKAGMKESYDNYVTLAQEFPDQTILPVYHSGEDIRLRNMYIDLTDHICLSMSQRLSEIDRVKWAMEHQVPGIKMHGLAATGNEMLTYVDWYSVDSATWVIHSTMGLIYFKTKRGLRPYSISSRSPRAKIRNTHLSNMTFTSDIYKQIEEHGYTVEELAEDYAARMKWNIDMLLTLDLNNKQVMMQGGLFD